MVLGFFRRDPRRNLDARPAGLPLPNGREEAGLFAASGIKIRIRIKIKRAESMRYEGVCLVDLGPLTIAC